jgi:hypothetical protein
VTAAFIAPSLIPGAAAPAGAFDWLVSGAVQSFSQCTLLIVIIGASGRLREYGLGRPTPADAPRALSLFVVILLASKAVSLAFSLWGTVRGGAAATLPPPDGIPTAGLVALSALFSFAVAYREESFYRVYLLRSLRERGAGKAAAILVSTGLFAAGHTYQGAPGIVSATFVGLAAAIAAVMGWSLHALALAHAAYDFGVLLAAFGVLGATGY